MLHQKKALLLWIGWPSMSSNTAGRTARVHTTVSDAPLCRTVAMKGDSCAGDRAVGEYMERDCVGR
jgi:hypothetical protein